MSERRVEKLTIVMNAQLKAKLMEISKRSHKSMSQIVGELIEAALPYIDVEHVTTGEIRIRRPMLDATRALPIVDGEVEVEYEEPG